MRAREANEACGERLERRRYKERRTGFGDGSHPWQLVVVAELLRAGSGQGRREPPTVPSLLTSMLVVKVGLAFPLLRHICAWSM